MRLVVRAPLRRRRGTLPRALSHGLTRPRRRRRAARVVQPVPRRPTSSRSTRRAGSAPTRHARVQCLSACTKSTRRFCDQHDSSWQVAFGFSLPKLVASMRSAGTPRSTRALPDPRRHASGPARGCIPRRRARPNCPGARGDPRRRTSRSPPAGGASGRRSASRCSCRSRTGRSWNSGRPAPRADAPTALLRSTRSSRWRARAAAVGDRRGGR